MRILLVEDDASQRELLKRVLVDEGHEVVEAADAEAAVIAPGVVDLIVCDYGLPRGRTARDVAKVRKERLVVLSGYDQPEDWDVPWFRKPVSFDALRAFVHELTTS